MLTTPKTEDSAVHDRAPRLAVDEARNAIANIRDWVLTDGVQETDLDALIKGYAHQLLNHEVPVDRVSASIRVLQATVLAQGTHWFSYQPMRHTTWDWDERDLGLYERSPLKVAHDTGEWVAFKLADTPDSAFGIVADLREEGYTHYVAAPMAFQYGSKNTVTYATRAKEGFSARDLAILRGGQIAFAVALELRALAQIQEEVLGIYVGTDAARSILDGTVHRGQITRIRSAIMLTDMREFTRRTLSLNAEEAAELLNTYYDCVVPHIEAEGGSVLKFIGDGILAIFPDEDLGGAGAACGRALNAARQTLQGITRRNSEISGSEQGFTIGVALHYGRAAYGNVGSGERLDFTVIGRDVNLTSRVQQLNSELRKPLLASAEFAKTSGEDMDSAGKHAVPGYEEGIEVFEPWLLG